MNKPEMEPCPHCAGTDAFVERADYSSCYVVCNDCGARGPTSCNENDEDCAAEDAGMEPGENAARRLWNRRTRPAQAGNALELAEELRDGMIAVARQLADRDCGARQLADRDCGARQSEMRQAQIEWLAERLNAHQPPVEPTQACNALVGGKRLCEWVEDAVRQSFIEGAEWQKQGRPGRFTDAIQKTLAPQLDAFAALRQPVDAIDAEHPDHIDRLAARMGARWETRAEQPENLHAALLETREMLALVEPIVCDASCPSKWETNKGQPHNALHNDLRSVLFKYEALSHTPSPEKAEIERAIERTFNAMDNALPAKGESWNTCFKRRLTDELLAALASTDDGEEG